MPMNCIRAHVNFVNYTYFLPLEPGQVDDKRANTAA